MTCSRTDFSELVSIGEPKASDLSTIMAIKSDSAFFLASMAFSSGVRRSTSGAFDRWAANMLSLGPSRTHASSYTAAN